jgi:hypothetical protein
MVHAAVDRVGALYVVRVEASTEDEESRMPRSAIGALYEVRSTRADERALDKSECTP